MAKTIPFEVKSGAREELTKLKAERDVLTAKINETAVEALKELCAEVFSKSPDLEQFGWVQFGGTYNDEGPYEGINQVGVNEELENYDEVMCRWQGGPEPAEEIKTALDRLGVEVIMDALGTDRGGYGGCDFVTVTRSGINVDTYERW